MPRVSVVVPTRNSASKLEQLLLSVRRQSEPVELVVVDNHSTDETKSIAAHEADLVLDAGPERSSQRNVGVAEATGEFVLLVDSDMVLEPQTVAECVTAAEDADAVAVVVPESTVGEGALAHIRALERSCYEGDETIEAARCFRRDAFLEYGGYDEELWAGEDWDLPQRMREEGEKITRAEEARLLHDEDGVSLVEHLRKKFYYGRSMGRYLRKHPAVGAKQASPIRPAFLRHWRRLAAHPCSARE